MESAGWLLAVGLVVITLALGLPACSPSEPEVATTPTSDQAAPRADDRQAGDAVEQSLEKSTAAFTPQERRVWFRDVTDQTGIDYVNTNGASGDCYIVETVCAGVALLDYDNDGDLDIYFLNGAPLPLGKKTEGELPTNRLYRNDGNWKFTDVSKQAGVACTGYSLGVAVGDYDNDGDLDIYVTNFGPNVLYRNNGDGTFDDVAEEKGMQDGQRLGAGAAFFDMDNDGDLDLYSANYVKFSYDKNPRRHVGGFLRYPGPMDFEADTDTLFRNNGDGTFTDISEESGIAQHAGTGMGVVATDYDNDGDVDVFVCNDVAANFLFRNDGGGHFEEVALETGVAYNSLGRANASMGVDCADYDNDGWFDFFMTAYQSELPVLYKCITAGLYEDVSLAAQVGEGCLQHINWGVGFADFDNDGWRDVYVANGHVEDQIDAYDDTTTYRAPNALFINAGNGKFVNVSASAGDGLQARGSSRGTTMGDLDNDGDIDIVVLNVNERPTILRNETENDHHWLQLRLVGRQANRVGVGARVTVISAGLKQIDEVRSGRSYQSHHDLRLHFGLGQSDRVEQIEIKWPGGATQQLRDVPVDQCLTVIEDTSGQ